MSEIKDHLLHLIGCVQQCRCRAADLRAFGGSGHLIKKMLMLADAFEAEAAGLAGITKLSDESELVWLPIIDRSILS